MKKLLLFITALCVCAVSIAQTLSPTVVASSGGYFTSASGSLSTTIGETMVQTFSTPGNILTQGFQQPEDFAVSIAENNPSSGDVMIYPNPTNGQFYLSFVSDKEKESDIKLFNVIGQVVLTKCISIAKGLNTVKFDLSNYSQGIYMLELDLTGSKPSYYKVNLIY